MKTFYKTLEKQREYALQYYREHREAKKEYQRQYQQEYYKRNRFRNDNGGVDDTRQAKKCTICGQYLPLCCFSHNRLNWDGLEYYCRGCNVIKARQWRAKNPKRMREILYTSMAKHRDRQNARSLAHFHFRQRQVCSIKGCNELGERHHPNYSNPKEIIWLCKEHHNLLVQSMI